MPIVDVQKYVDFTNFTAHNRNFEIIYIFKSCKHSLRFVVQVCLDHALHMDISKVKNTESKHSASETISWSLCVMHVQGHFCIRQSRLQLTNVHPTLGYRNVLGNSSQTHTAILICLIYIIMQRCGLRHRYWQYRLRRPGLQCRDTLRFAHSTVLAAWAAPVY